MKKFIFVAFFAVCSIGFASKEIVNEKVNIVTVDEGRYIVKSEGVAEYRFNEYTQMYDCRVFTSLTIVDKYGNSTRVWEGYVIHPDGYEGCGGTELTVIKVPW